MIVDDSDFLVAVDYENGGAYFPAKYARQLQHALMRLQLELQDARAGILLALAIGLTLGVLLGVAI